MRLVVIRHAIAEDREAFAGTGRPDAERPLTEEGRRRMVAASRGLQTIVPRLDRLASSPFTRAEETAAIVAGAYEGVEPETAACFEPGTSSDAVVAWLRELEEDGTVAIVGHEPDLSTLVTYFVTGSAFSGIELKKGAVCLVAFPGGLGPGTGVLRWLLAPKHLRALGGGDA